MKLQKIMRRFIVSLLLSMLIICQPPFNIISNGEDSNSKQQEKQEENNQRQQGHQNPEQTIETDSKFDLALRKVITEVKDKEGNTKDIVNENKQPNIRNVKIEKNNEEIIYKHRKAPVLVEKGDIVIYTITIYNEGEESGNATKIVDQLPGTPTTGLRLLNTKEIKSTTGNTYTIEYSITTNTVIFTLKSTNPKAIPAFTGTTLSREEIKLECQVMADIDTKQSTILTNIAYIEEAYNSETNEVITMAGDRDSQPAKYPSYQNENDTKQDGITYGNDIGYIGNINNLTDLARNDIYYKGQEDDDDYEKLIMVPNIFDLSLREVITKVDGESTQENRKIVIEGLEKIETENIEVENAEVEDTEKTNITTAQYKHTKEPLIVKNGSKVSYNINIYNEASIDGIATIIKSQLPTGLQLNLSSLSTQLIEGKTQYYIITEKGNKYIVQYDETMNTITFQLDTNMATTNIEAFSKRETLDFDTLEYECIVQCIADEQSNTYLTSISYIYEEQKADGTIITNQKGEDRDSEPHTISIKTAQELKTINDIGYKGNAENPTDLGQKDTYYKGEQDDDDFEKLVILPQVFDLKLIQFADKASNEDTEEKIIKVDTSKLNTTDITGRKITTAEYEIEKKPISVKVLDFIKYTFRVYNEGDYDGCATEISVNIPKGLESLMIGKDSSNNIVIYSWDGIDLKDVTEEIKATDMYDEVIEINSIWGYSASTSIIKTTGLKEEIIKAFGINDYENYADKENKIDYKEISVIYRVKESIVLSENPIVSESSITGAKAVNDNEEEIADLIGNQIKDRDSNPNEWEKEYLTLSQFTTETQETEKTEEIEEIGANDNKTEDEDIENTDVENVDLESTKATITENGEQLIIETGNMENDISNEMNQGISSIYIKLIIVLCPLVLVGAILIKIYVL